jgi:S-adenosylmethionine decarboxylase
MKNLGWHFLVELNGCDRHAVDDPVFLRTTLIDALRAAGATIIQDVFHQFSPQGVTGIVAIAESHASIHTWPEHGYAAVDLFSCTQKLDAQAVIDALAVATRAKSIEVREILRGREPQRERLSLEPLAGQSP